MPKVFNRYRDEIPEDGVFIGRPTPLGNPFRIGIDGNRYEVVERYRIWINEPEQAALRDLIKIELKGKDLICFCSPQLCHGDVILEIANKE